MVGLDAPGVLLMHTSVIQLLCISNSLCRGYESLYTLRVLVKMRLFQVLAKMGEAAATRNEKTQIDFEAVEGPPGVRL